MVEGPKSNEHRIFKILEFDVSLLAKFLFFPKIWCIIWCTAYTLLSRLVYWKYIHPPCLIFYSFFLLFVDFLKMNFFYSIPLKSTCVFLSKFWKWTAKKAWGCIRFQNCRKLYKNIHNLYYRLCHILSRRRFRTARYARNWASGAPAKLETARKLRKLRS